MNVYTRDYIISLKDENNLELPEITKLFSTLSIEANKNRSSRSKKSFNNDTWRRKKPKISALEYKDDTDKISKKINVNLNKLSDSNFDAISNNIVELISEHSFLIIFLDAVFNKAIEQPTYCKVYIKLCKLICGLEINKDDFLESILIKKCNEMINNFNENTSSIADVKDYDNFCKDTKNKLTKIGSVRFIGELYNINMINTEAICLLVNSFIQQFKNENFKTDLLDLLSDSISQLLYTIWDKLSTEKADLFENIITDIRKFSKNKSYPPKIRFKMMDIGDKYKKM
jgi:translation initiation factor 4G